MSSKTDNSAETNPAVFRCNQAWREAYQATIDENKGETHAWSAAAGAYSEAMPPLFGVRNIRNFIACVAHGSMLGIIDGADCSRLLYAAQIAFSTRRIRPRTQKSAPRPASKKSPSGAISEPQKAVQEPFPAPVDAG